MSKAQPRPVRGATGKRQPRPAARAPAVSVILPVRDRAALVEAAARSVLDQTWRDLELVVVDGASKDGTVDVLRRLAGEDPRVRLVLQRKANGVAAARNEGVATSSGRLLAFQDSDDAWHPEKLARQVAALEALPGARMAYTGLKRHFRGGTVLRPADWKRPPQGDLHARLLRGNFIPTPTLLIERTLFDEAGGFDERLSFHEDWDLAVRASALSPVACAADYLVDSPQLPDGLTRDIASLRRAFELLVEKHEPFLRPRPRLHEYRLARLAWSYLINRRGAGWPYLRRALAVRPWSLHGPTWRAALDAWRTMRTTTGTGRRKAAPAAKGAGDRNVAP